jgi:hypothetical protein
MSTANFHGPSNSMIATSTSAICVILSNSSFLSWRGKKMAYSSPHCRPMKKKTPRYFVSRRRSVLKVEIEIENKIFFHFSPIIVFGFSS